MKILRLLSLLLLVAGPLSGQPNTTYTEDDLRALSNLGPNSPGIHAIDLTYEGVKGTTFLTKDWQEGSFQVKGKDEFGQELPIQIDLEKQLLYFRMKNGFMGSIPANKLNAFQLKTGADQFRLFRVYPESDIEGSNGKREKFYEVLFHGSFTLLKRHYKRFQEANYKSAYATGKPYDEYIDESDLWLQESGQPFFKVKLKRKSIEKALPNYAAQVQKVIKSERLAMQQETDLIRLLEVLSSSGN